MLQKPGLANQLNTLKVILVVITLIAVIAYPYIPKRLLNVYPETEMWWGAYTDVFSGGNSQFEYLNDDQSAILCTMGEAGSFNICGNNGVFAGDDIASYEQLTADERFAMSVSPRITRDFSSYQGIWLDIDYRGPADFIFITIQNHEPIEHMPDPNRQFRPQIVGISTSELHKPVYIALEDFKVGDWWVHQFSLHRKKAGARFDRVRAKVIEVKDEPVGSQHHLEVKSITFSGDWISQANFYLIIIVVLVSLLLIEVTMRVYGLYVSHRATQRSLEEVSERNKNLQSAAYRDELTQLLNRRAIYDIVLSGFERKSEQFIAILVIDIDHFKKFNDTFGHTLGDEVLVSVAKTLKSASREYDQIARWGGEEFVIITQEGQSENLIKYHCCPIPRNKKGLSLNKLV